MLCVNTDLGSAMGLSLSCGARLARQLNWRELWSTRSRLVKGSAVLLCPDVSCLLQLIVAREISTLMS